MILELKDTYGVFDNKALFLNDDNVIIHIKHSLPSNVELSAIVKNNENIKTISVINNEVEIERDWIKSGSLDIKICLLFCGKIIKTITCESLIIQDFDYKIETIPQIAQMKNTLLEFHEEIEKLSKKIDKLMILVGTLYNKEVEL